MKRHLFYPFPMIRFCFILSFSLVTSVFSFAQSDTIATAAKAKRFNFKTNPLQLLLTGEVRLITEKHLNKNNSVELITSYFINHSLFNQSYGNLFSSQSGFKIGAGYRYYLGSTNIYINPLFFYKQMNYTNVRIGTFLTSSDDRKYYNYISHIYSFQFQVGKKFENIDCYAGIGIRYIHNLGVLVYDCRDHSCRSAYNPFSLNSEIVVPTMHLGVNIGYIK